MQKLLINLATVGALLLFSAPSFALLEFNIGYAGIVSSSAGGNWALPNASFTGAYGLQADVRLNFPTSDWNFGVRYSNLGLSTAANGSSMAMSNTAYSALLGYRIIDTGILFGPVVTYAFGNTGSLQNSLASTGSNPAAPSNVTQYTAGLEFGLKFPVLLAVEMGYGSLAMGGFSNAQTLNGQPTQVNLSGTYARASVGFSL